MTDVIHVISGLGTGGAETMLVQLAVGLRARGLSQHVVSLGKLDTHAAELRAAGIEVTVLNAGGPLSFAGALYGLLCVARRLRPRILQGWMYHGNIAATLCHYICGGRARRKLFWNLRASNMDEARYSGIIRLSALLSRLPDLIHREFGGRRGISPRPWLSAKTPSDRRQRHRHRKIPPRPRRLQGRARRAWHCAMTLSLRSMWRASIP